MHGRLTVIVTPPQDVGLSGVGVVAALIVDKYGPPSL